MAIHISGKKYLTIDKDVIDFSNPKKVYVPLVNQGRNCTCKTKIGSRVKKGTVIGIREDINFPILSPVSGTVTGIKEHLYANGSVVNCVIIDNDFKEKCVSTEVVEDITKYTKEEFIELLRTCSIVGMGGSDFPAFLKYKSDANILIVNAVECEPYLTSDATLIKLKADLILECIDALVKINKFDKCFIAVKKSNKVAYNSLMKYIGNYNNIVIAQVSDVYPAGWERKVVKDVLGITYDKYPSEVGVIVSNVSSIFSMYKALKYKRNSTKRIITISGEAFSKPVNVLVKVGTNMRKVIESVGSYKQTNIVIISGGPMMGVSLPSTDFVVSNCNNGVTILKVKPKKVTDCISCGKCVNICPMKLCPIDIKNNIDNKDELRRLKPKSCIECGLCTYVCPAKINLREYVKEAKGVNYDKD